MEKIKGFMKNFGISFLAYSSTSLLGLAALAVRVHATRVPNVVLDAPRDVPFWVNIIFGLHTILSIVVYFYVGTKLKLLGNHLLNFLSVSWGIIFGLMMAWLGSYMLIFPQFSFLGLVVVIDSIIGNNLLVIVTTTSVLPAAITWFGMLYQSTKIKCLMK